MKSNKKILHVEDDQVISRVVYRILSERFDHVYSAKNGKEGLDMFLKHNPDLVITDIKMPIMDGLELVKKIREQDSNIPIIVLSAYEERFLSLPNFNILKFILKPTSAVELAYQCSIALNKDNNL